MLLLVCNPQMQAAATDVGTLRCSQVEPFALGSLPSDPVYDLPSWLEHNYPQFDASPKSPLYSWQVMRVET